MPRTAPQPSSQVRPLLWLELRTRVWPGGSLNPRSLGPQVGGQGRTPEEEDGPGRRLPFAPRLSAQVRGPHCPSWGLAGCTATRRRAGSPHRVPWHNLSGNGAEQSCPGCVTCGDRRTYVCVYFYELVLYLLISCMYIITQAKTESKGRGKIYLDRSRASDAWSPGAWALSAVPRPVYWFPFKAFCGGREGALCWAPGARRGLPSSVRLEGACVLVRRPALRQAVLSP